MNIEISLVEIDTRNRYLSLLTVSTGGRSRSLLYVEIKPHYKEIEIGFIQVYRKLV
jgi:hypothetical protein